MVTFSINEIIDTPLPFAEPVQEDFWIKHLEIRKPNSDFMLAAATRFGLKRKPDHAIFSLIPIFLVTFALFSGFLDLDPLYGFSKADINVATVSGLDLRSFQAAVLFFCGRLAATGTRIASGPPLLFRFDY